MYEREEIIAYAEAGELMIGYERLVQQGVDYRTVLLPRLARVPVVEVLIYHSVYADKVSPQVGTNSFISSFQDPPVLELPRLSLEYEGTHCSVSATIPAAPEEWRVAERSFPRSVTSV